MVQASDYNNDFENKWCPGCGNFLILNAMKQAFAAQDIPPEKMMFISGIGQAGKTPHFIQGNIFHTLHGRALPVATGAKTANHDLNIVVNSGDGDCYGEGGNHFLAAIRRNVDITLLVHNNQVYGLTKGQASPTTPLGTVTRLQSQGTTSQSFNPMAVALAAGIGFLARGFSGKTEQLTGLIQRAMAYPGFALVDILQPCVSFNKINTQKWYMDRVYDIDEADHDNGDFAKAMALAMEWGDKIPTGVLYEQATVPFHQRIKALGDQTLISHTFDAKKVAGAIA